MLNTHTRTAPLLSHLAHLPNLTASTHLSCALTHHIHTLSTSGSGDPSQSKDGLLVCIAFSNLSMQHPCMYLKRKCLLRCTIDIGGNGTSDNDA